jgi:hypothetical protein
MRKEAHRGSLFISYACTVYNNGTVTDWFIRLFGASWINPRIRLVDSRSELFTTYELRFDLFKPRREGSSNDKDPLVFRKDPSHIPPYFKPHLYIVITNDHASHYVLLRTPWSIWTIVHNMILMLRNENYFIFQRLDWQLYIKDERQSFVTIYVGTYYSIKLPVQDGKPPR